MNWDILGQDVEAYLKLIPDDVQMQELLEILLNLLEYKNCIPSFFDRYSFSF